MANEVAKRADVREITPIDLLQKAVESGADLDKLEKLMQLERQWKADRAREAFIEAMTAFKADPPTILKNKLVNIPGGARFSHATLAQVVDAVCAGLSKYGLSHSWETQQEANTVTVTCILTHQLGHCERTTLSAAPDDSGKKNSIQQIASTVTYLERYTLMAATGLAAKDMDDDGAAAEPVEPITEKQAADLQALIDEVASDPEKYRDRLLKYQRIETLADLPAAAFSGVVKQLEAKRK